MTYQYMCVSLAAARSDGVSKLFVPVCLHAERRRLVTYFLSAANTNTVERKRATVDSLQSAMPASRLRQSSIKCSQMGIG